MSKVIMKIIRHEIFLLYVLSGAIVTILELLIFYGLVNYYNWPYLVASCSSFSLGLIVSFFWRKYYVFNNHNIKELAVQFSLYSVIVALNTCLNYLLMRLFVGDLNENIIMAQVAVNTLLGIISYLFNKFITFKRVQNPGLNLPGKIADIKKDIKAR